MLRKVMVPIKNFTQSITTLLGILMFLLVAYALAIFLSVTGNIEVVDSFYPNNLAGYLVLMIISRAIYIAGTGSICWMLIDYLVKKGFFWSEKGSKLSIGKDKSEAVFSFFFAILVLLVVGEFLIRLFAWSLPPYFL